ncbi:MAG: hypothetical protein AAFZ52_11145 [Bacteroidota bacterium]
MRYIKELVDITHGSASLASLADYDNTDAIAQLYRAIRGGSDATETEVARLVYGPKATPRLPAYQKLKSRLRNSLLDALLLDNPQDKPDYSNYAATYRTLRRQYASAQILATTRAYHNAARLLERIYRVAEKNHMTEMQYLTSKALTGLFLGLVYDKRKFSLYSERLGRHRQEFVVLNDSIQAVYQFKAALYNRNGPTIDIGKLALTKAKELQPLAEGDFATYTVKSNYLYLSAYGHYLHGHFRQSIKFAREAEAMIQQLDIKSTRKLYRFRILRVQAHGFLGEISAGYQIMDHIESGMKAGTVNWLDLMEEKSLFCLRNGLYDDAVRFVTPVSRKRIMHKLSENLSQTWEVIFAILHLLDLCGELREETWSDKRGNFRLQRFLNKLPTYAKEKRGINVLILVLHTIFLIILERFDEVIDRVEALEKYCSRYLTNDSHLRSNCFIKMLTATVKGNFHAVATKRYAQRYQERLLDTKPDLIDRVGNLEIIPYEKLWEILQRYLGTTIHEVRAR